MSLNTTLGRVAADGLSFFYREAGSPTAPTILLLHGFPASSFQYRNLIPLLAENYHVIAPDLPGFGFTTVPAARNYKYTFANFALSILAFLDALNIKNFAVYMFDYGAPTALRIALQRPEAVKAIISQNGNAYEAGLGDAWVPIKQYWKTNSTADREVLRNALITYDFTKFQYENGTPAELLGQIDPATYTLDWALISSEEQQNIQLDIFRDYETNVELYPDFHRYFKKSQVPILVTWGKNDIIFVYPGAEAFKGANKNVVIKPVDAGHFAVETHYKEIAGNILEFLPKYGF